MQARSQAAVAACGKDGSGCKWRATGRARRSFARGGWSLAVILHTMTRKVLLIGKAFVWAGCLAPLAWLVVRGFEISGWTLGPNPVETVRHTFGKTSLNLLLLTLAVTPVRRIIGWNALVRFRRLVGLFAFFYLVMHFLAYALLDLRLQWDTIGTDIVARPYITVGVLALLAMIPLAVTSTRGMQRRLGRNWAKLHRLIYPIGILAVIHFQW